MKQIALMMLTLAVLAFGRAPMVFAHGGHEHKVMGTVTMAAADHIMVKDTGGKNVTVKVTKTTKVKAKPAVKVQDIKAGTRVVIAAIENNDKTMTANSIEVGAAAAAK